jgi:hypothetical protein
LSSWQDYLTPIFPMSSCHIYMVNIKVAFDVYPPRSVANIFATWLHSIDHRFKTLNRVGAFVIIWSLWLYRNDKVFNDKNSSLLPGTLSLWTFLQRVENHDLFMEVLCTVRDSTRNTFPNMGGRIIYGLDHHHLRRLVIAHYDMYFAFQYLLP